MIIEIPNIVHTISSEQFSIEGVRAAMNNWPQRFRDSIATNRNHF